MKGKHKIIVSTKRLKYEFELRRNLTIIQETVQLEKLRS